VDVKLTGESLKQKRTKQKQKKTKTKAKQKTDKRLRKVLNGVLLSPDMRVLELEDSAYQITFKRNTS